MHAHQTLAMLAYATNPIALNNHLADLKIRGIAILSRYYSFDFDYIFIIFLRL
jgi:hypothetical protein